MCLFVFFSLERRAFFCFCSVVKNVFSTFHVFMRFLLSQTFTRQDSTYLTEQFVFSKILVSFTNCYNNIPRRNGKNCITRFGGWFCAVLCKYVCGQLVFFLFPTIQCFFHDCEFTCSCHTYLLTILLVPGFPYKFSAFKGDYLHHFRVNLCCCPSLDLCINRVNTAEIEFSPFLDDDDDDKWRN